jgi:hypothetical protein
MNALATQLFREVRPDFFRMLAGPFARLYVDALDALERESSQRNQGLDRAEALALLEQVVEQHEDLADASDELVAVAATNPAGGGTNPGAACRRGGGRQPDQIFNGKRGV